MKLRLPLLLAAGLALLAWGLSASQIDAGRGDAVPVTWLEAAGHEPGAAIPGAYAVQQRGYYSITTSLHSRELAPGHQYTLWWVIFNNPGACVDGCGSDDLTSAIETSANPAGIGVHYGGSFVVAANGRLDIGARILEFSVNGCQTVAPFAGLCNPLLDAATAEAIVFLHDHGPAVSGASFDVASAFAQGCKSYKVFDTVVSEYNLGDFECFSAQAIDLK